MASLNRKLTPSERAQLLALIQQASGPDEACLINQKFTEMINGGHRKAGAPVQSDPDNAADQGGPVGAGGSIGAGAGASGAVAVGAGVAAGGLAHVVPDYGGYLRAQMDQQNLNMCYVDLANVVQRQNAGLYQQQRHAIAQLAGMANTTPSPSIRREPPKHEGSKFGEVIGFRAWEAFDYGDGYRLRSMFAEEIWEPGKVMSGDPNTPDGYGVHAFKCISLACEQYGRCPGNLRIYGRIAMWGEIVEHDKGYRVEHARPIGFDGISPWTDESDKILTDLTDLYCQPDPADGA